MDIPLPDPGPDLALEFYFAIAKKGGLPSPGYLLCSPRLLFIREFPLETTQFFHSIYFYFYF